MEATAIFGLANDGLPRSAVLRRAPHGLWVELHSQSCPGSDGQLPRRPRGTWPADPHPRDVRYTVTLYNTTNWTIGYSLNDQREPRIGPGESVRWTIMGSRENPAVFNIAFDNGARRTVQYRLQNNASFDFKE